ncbi:hypothetical protein U0070_019841 [Myodes glareolus]|uniref:Uncharacterized protein n=1 Tax=Myodes glareolus TaxID=447135 RepID=A0AAW0IEV6_MYOGA
MDKVQEGEYPNRLDPKNPVYAEETSPSVIVNGFSERLQASHIQRIWLDHVPLPPRMPEKYQMLNDWEMFTPTKGESYVIATGEWDAKRLVSLKPYIIKFSQIYVERYSEVDAKKDLSRGSIDLSSHWLWHHEIMKVTLQHIQASLKEIAPAQSLKSLLRMEPFK